MSEQQNQPANQKTVVREIHKNTQGNAVYGLGFIGAVIYYITVATSFWTGVIGVLKAIVWPAIVVYKALEFFSM